MSKHTVYGREKTDKCFLPAFSTRELWICVEGPNGFDQKVANARIANASPV